MRNMTQERIEGLAKERGAATIDLAIVEGGIEIGKQMMAEMIQTYQRPAAANAASSPAVPNEASKPAVSIGAGSESTPTAPMSPSSPAGARGYLNEVRTLSASAPTRDGSDEGGLKS
jgi:hypothetical protein